VPSFISVAAAAFGLKGAEAQAQAEAHLEAMRLPARHTPRFPGLLQGNGMQPPGVACALAACSGATLCGAVA